MQGREVPPIHPEPPAPPPRPPTNQRRDPPRKFDNRSPTPTILNKTPLESTPKGFYSFGAEKRRAEQKRDLACTQLETERVLANAGAVSS